MRFRDLERSAVPDAAEAAPAAVTQCPFCKSHHVTTTGNAGSLSTYWRCHACGEIWNPTRQASQPRHRGW